MIGRKPKLVGLHGEKSIQRSMIGMLRKGGLIFTEISLTFSKWKHLTAPEPGAGFTG